LSAYAQRALVELRGLDQRRLPGRVVRRVVHEAEDRVDRPVDHDASFDRAHLEISAAAPDYRCPARE
jgi:hypothetical protein